MTDINELFNAPIESGDRRSPLREFKGICTEIMAKSVTFGERTQQRVVFQFNNLEVVASTEPYVSPTAELEFNPSNRDNTVWVAVRKSVEQFVAADSDGRRDIYSIKGKMSHWKMLPAKVSAPVRLPDGTTEQTSNGRDKFAVQDIDCWQMVALEGSNGPDSGNIYEAVADMLTTAMTEPEFNTKLFNNTALRSISGHSAVIAEAQSRKLLTTLEVMKLVKQDGDKWVKV